MIEQEQEPHVCYECDAEFIVHTPYDDENMVSFCPFCGSEMEQDPIDCDDVDEDEEY